MEIEEEQTVPVDAIKMEVVDTNDEAVYAADNDKILE